MTHEAEQNAQIQEMSSRKVLACGNKQIKAIR